MPHMFQAWYSGSNGTSPIRSRHPAWGMNIISVYTIAELIFDFAIVLVDKSPPSDWNLFCGSEVIPPLVIYFLRKRRISIAAVTCRTRSPEWSSTDKISSDFYTSPSTLTVMANVLLGSGIGDLSKYYSSSATSNGYLNFVHEVRFSTKDRTCWFKSSL